MPGPTRRELVVSGLALAAMAGVPVRGLAAEPVKIRDLWGRGGEFSALATGLAGRSVSMQGYMAPPLKPEIDFFVLTRIPMAVCPFCDTEAAWPNDLIVAYVAQGIAPVPFNDLIRVTGTLELGTATDAKTGFVSRIRLAQAEFALV